MRQAGGQGIALVGQGHGFEHAVGFFQQVAPVAPDAPEVEAGTGTGLTNGADIIPWSEILASSTDATNFNVPAVGANTAPVINSGKVTNRTATWNFAYSNTAVAAPGTYSGQVTYTATMP